MTEHIENPDKKGYKMVAAAENTAEKWAQTYASRIYELYTKFQSPLGIAEEFRMNLVKQLKEEFSQPLRRDLIEKTYKN